MLGKMNIRVPTLAFTLSLGLRQVFVPADGSCFYHAVSLYLNKAVKELREMTAQYIEDEMKRDAKYAETVQAVSTRMYNITSAQYLTRMRDANAHQWADDLQVNALMRSLNRLIVIVGPNGTMLNRTAFDAYPNAQNPIFIYSNGRDHFDGLLLAEQANVRRILNSIRVDTDLQSTIELYFRTTGHYLRAGSSVNTMDTCKKENSSCTSYLFPLGGGVAPSTSSNIESKAAITTCVRAMSASLSSSAHESISSSCGSSSSYDGMATQSVPITLTPMTTQTPTSTKRAVPLLVASSSNFFQNCYQENYAAIEASGVCSSSNTIAERAEAETEREMEKLLAGVGEEELAQLTEEELQKLYQNQKQKSSPS